MIKCIAILFLFIYLLGATPLGQLCKLPMLIEHYQEHQKENKDISFLSFLKMHYFNGDPKDADYEDDMKLPFKTIDVNTALLAFVAFENPTFKLERSIFIELRVNKTTSSDSWHTNKYLSAIWKPPRTV